MLYETEPNGHKFSVGDEAILIDLETAPNYNGSKVKIIGIRKDAEFGKAYYVEGEINVLYDWVYEYRLCKKDDSQDNSFMKKVFKEYFNWPSDYRLYKKHK